MNLKPIVPQFGVNYFTGSIGFTMAAADLVSEGIAYFQRWECSSGIQVSHTFVVTGNDSLVEAHIEHGVQTGTISKYLYDSRYKVYFRTPRGLHPQLGWHIASAALAKVGCPYARGLIAAEAAGKTIFGHWLNKLLHEAPNRVISQLLRGRNEFICSELVAYALYRQKEFRRVGILANPLDTIDPQALFEDQYLFTPGALVAENVSFQPIIPSTINSQS